MSRPQAEPLAHEEDYARKTSPLTQRRSVFMAPTSMATGWRRFSELILLPGQLGDAVTRPFGDGSRELGDLVRPSRGVKDHGREPEPALQWSLPGVHVLDAGQRHERAADPEDPTLQVHLVGPNLVAPPPPPQPGYHPDDHSGQREYREHGQKPKRREKPPERDKARPAKPAPTSSGSMLRVPVILHTVMARGSSLSAGSPFKS